MSGTPIYRKWSSMLERCTNPKQRSYRWYGAVGITVCDEWARSFEAFYRDMGELPPGLTIDRIDSRKGYSPDNCRWATPLQQGENLPHAEHIEVNGETHTICGWSKRLGIPRTTLVQRVNKYGWTWQRAISTPARKYVRSSHVQA